ncbi:TPA: ComC/BlpC family leader-containing pheromone/bacteriocin [Streptococcus suis]|uniref:ComC/BlpC family leader-containing pheromone/bacteriocin n=1 Tax=Streptococcus suis TaxID=1307 RepID=A0A6L8MXC5_STRSU|nr:ComC/BlpC family leader-containing pheromone/bacteriocin [Streptococcus suis]MDW8750528.1 ComC/BlpC family leader-containing pheromone/bacteriocin [Streptococcus suis]MYN69780.1 ComC/BlpC family leader-containing pheromone/bacteriocin [Streptococcus suis]HEL2383523.1 ComC/BlpC family leader-containing pheromone/bacteriocin [Streptococcus suis]HEP1819317.1 ComC/BlpC family leader-containing pheromone/bacteriocin [Streptococcus suis]
MTKQTKSLTQFSELTSSELHRISGGDWWTDILKGFIRGDSKKTSETTLPKIG